MRKICKSIVYVIAFLLATNISAQVNAFAAPAPANNSLGIYIGMPLFHNTAPIINSLFTVYPKNPIVEGLLSLKLGNHEFVGGAMFCGGHSGNFLVGESASYLIHFSNRRLHPFIELNYRYLKYTSNTNGSPVPYSQSTDWPTNGSGLSDAKIKTNIFTAALGVEAKIWKVIFCQLAIGEGYYHVNAKKGLQASQHTLDPYYLFNFYGKHAGANWYARFTLVFRLYKF